mgnify:CR=1 FL=1|jgi:hypothetical protein|tara:strand:+ start:369 stop:1055 length:687 start_codon:yes stop_codon:yes gene_type:complete
MIHYHGTPITPNTQLATMAGKNFCVSYARPDNLKTCLAIAQSIMFDNGAYSIFTGAVKAKDEPFHIWIEQYLAHPHWAVIPDQIDGSVEDNIALINEWHHQDSLSAPVWHLNEPIEHLLFLADNWGRVCFGSSGEYWEIGSVAWCFRVDKAFNALAKRFNPLPWIHMMRGLSLAGQHWPFASADSTSVARHCGDTNRRNRSAGDMAVEIDSRQCPINWQPRLEQTDLL